MIQQFLDAWADDQMRHAMTVHFPIVLSLAALPFAAFAAIWQKRESGRVFRWITLAAYLALTMSLYVARESGHDAEHAVGPLTEAGEQEMEAHEHHGHNLWMIGLLLSAGVGAGFVPFKAVRIASAWLVVGGGLLLAERVAHTADHGGRLVYVHGAAAPTPIETIHPVAADDTPADPRLVHFRDEVRPLLVENCLRCHNPNRLRRSGQLDLTTVAGALKGGVSGPAIVPGRPDDSLLIAAVRWDSPDLEMPRGGDQLTDDRIAVLVRWIADGAVWEAFEYTPPPPKKRE